MYGLIVSKRVGVECVLIPGRDIPGENSLVLVLSQLIEVVRNLKPVARREQIQVEHVLAGGLKVEAVEDCCIVSLVVKRSKFRGVQEPPGPKAIDGYEVSELRGSVAQADVAAGATEGPIVGLDVAEKPSRS